MRLILFFLALLTLLTLPSLTAQKGDYKRLAKKERVNVLAQAKALRESNPKEAIQLLSQLISTKPSPSEVVGSFTLLGDIYGDIGQYDLALERYGQALEAVPAKSPQSFAPALHLRMGDSHRLLGEGTQARASYTRCLSTAPASSAQTQTCNERLALMNRLDVSSDAYGDDLRSIAIEATEPIENQSNAARQVDVLRGQNTIDLSLKDMAAAAAESEYARDRIQLQTWLIYLLGLLLVGALISVVLILRNVRKRRRANQELLLRNLQTRMNPHFIFNSLNSINNYIARQDERSANRYLGRFAKLMRGVLDQSGRDFVPLSEEIEQLGLYLELEQERFAGKFTYTLEKLTAGEVDAEEVMVPPMLLQPYVENAIWHGLRYRPEGGELQIQIEVAGGKTVATIRDNGIGRAKSGALKTVNQLAQGSKGMDITTKRIELINRHFGKSLAVSIRDAYPGGEYPGTEVRLQLT